MESNRKTLHNLNSRDYEHPLDRKALKALEGTPGLEILVKKFNEYALERIFKVQYTGSNLKVNQKNFPDIYNTFMEACRIIDMPVIPDLYIMWDYRINAMTMGVEKPIVVLYSGCIDLMNEKELLFIIGHELGHIKSKHVLYHQMARIIPLLGKVLGKATLGVGELLSAGLELALLHWARMSEFTADRAGLLTCQSPDDAVSAFVKMAGIPKKYYNSLVVEDFIQQSRDFEDLNIDTIDRIAKVLVLAGQTHPWTVLRSSELIKWMDTNEYQDIINGKNSIMHKPAETSPQFCSSCGQRLISGDSFCTSCGKKVN